MLGCGRREGRRALHAVDYFGAADSGKVVWAEFAVPAEILTPAGLPRRVRGAFITTANQAGLIHDPALLRRVHRALIDL